MEKKAIVTGASEGIGRAIAKKLAKEGYIVTCVARNKMRLETLQKEMGSQHPIFVADLTKDEDISRVEKLFSMDHFDLLVNNAGQGAYGKFTDLPMEQLLHIFNLNCQSLLRLSHEFLCFAKAGDALVNVSSTLAFLPMASSATYCATKSFVTALSEALWFEGKSKDVYVMNLCPGLTKTEFSSRAGGRHNPPPESMFQSSEEVADEMFYALKKRCKPTVITGRRNRLLAFLTRILSRKRVSMIMGNIR